MARASLIYRKSILYIILSLGAVVMIFPFLWMISSSLKANLYVIEYPPQLIPSMPSLDNFIQAWNANHFQTYFMNSALVAILSTLLIALFSSMAAYAFARFKFPGREAIFFLLLAVMMVPNMIAIVPQFLLMKFLNLRNSLWGLMLTPLPDCRSTYFCCGASSSSSPTNWKKLC